MSPFLIFLIVVTIGYVIYYAAIITIDMNAKPKEAVSTGETMEAPDGMDVSEENEENDESEEETTSREADDENDDDTSGFSEEETDDDVNHDTNVNEVPPTIPPSEAESQSSDAEPSPEDDDDIYGIDKQTNDESVSEEETEPTSEQEEFPEVASDSNEYTDTESEQTADDDSDIDSTLNEDTDSGSEQISNEESDTDKYTPDEEDLEAVKERMRQHLAKVAQAEGAEIVDAEVHDDSEFEEKDSDVPLTLLDSDNYDTGRADEINESNESIITESMTPLRQDLFASTLFGALGRMKQEQKKTSDTPTINPDNIVKEENITKA